MVTTSLWRAPKHPLDWMKSEMQKRYELSEVGRLGPGAADGKEVKVLNRLVRWTEQGLEYEGDPRQSERLVLDLKLEGTKRVGTPGVKQTFEQIQQDKALPASKHTAFRAVTARAITSRLTAPRSSTPQRRFVGGCRHRRSSA